MSRIQFSNLDSVKNESFLIDLQSTEAHGVNGGFFFGFFSRLKKSGSKFGAYCQPVHAAPAPPPEPTPVDPH